MNDSMTVLVLGVGGNVSQGILKALALSKLSCRVIGACINPLSAGLYTVDRSYISPPADDPSFLDWLLIICQEESVHAILSGVEPVLARLSAHAEEIRQQTGAICIVSNSFLLSIADDKLLTCQWLQSQGFSFPRYAPSDDARAMAELVEQCGYPLIAKPRFGKGSHGLIEVRNSSDLSWVSSLDGYVIQESLGDSESEYTAACFCDRHGRARGTFVMRRELLQGTTYRAEVGEFQEIRSEAIRIVEKLQPSGPCNIQLRVSNGRPVCFEINLRFSGTTPMRVRLGFNEVEAALRNYVLGEEIEDLPLIKEGIVLRYWNEMYIDPQACDALRQSGRLDLPQQFDLMIEDYGMRP